MKIIAVIPARLKSKRFPKKILFPIEEKPMVVHVYENAKKSELINDVIVAVDDEETIKELKKWKVKTVMTDAHHSSGTDRVYEASKDTDAEVIVNLQADEPFLDPRLIDMLIQEFDDSQIEMATIAGKNLNVLATAECLDNGKPIRECMAADLPLVIDHWRYFAGVIRDRKSVV